MTSLSDKGRKTISEYPIGEGLSAFLKSYSEFVVKFPSESSCEKIALAAITGSNKGISL